MALNIKNEEAHKLAEELAKLKGISMTKAVTEALRDALDKNKRQTVPLLDRLEQISEHCSKLPIKDKRTADEILNYDNIGLPQ